MFYESQFRLGIRDSAEFTWEESCIALRGKG